MLGLKISLAAAFVLPLITSTNVDVYGSQDSLNESLAYKYGNPTEKSRMQIQELFSECVESSIKPGEMPDGKSGYATIYLGDKCKPVIDFYKNLGWDVTDIAKSTDNGLDTITLGTGFFSHGSCLIEKFEEHVLLRDADYCKRVTEYYVANGYDLVDKYNEKVELIQRQGNETGAIGNK
jgi:hypothetical protein